MIIHKVAIIRNRPSERTGSKTRYTRCGILVSTKQIARRWYQATCKNCLRTKA